jgi:Uma2 family endonuclease
MRFPRRLLDANTAAYTSAPRPRPQRQVVCDRPNGHLAPDLVVEILSPSTSTWDRIKKYGVYARHGVAEYWIVDPGHETVEIFVLRDGGYELASSGQRTGQLASATLPGLVVELERVFSKM